MPKNRVRQQQQPWKRVQKHSVTYGRGILCPQVVLPDLFSSQGGTLSLCPRVNVSSSFLFIYKAPRFWKLRRWNCPVLNEHFEQLSGEDMKCGYGPVLGQSRGFTHTRHVHFWSPSTAGRLSSCLHFSDFFCMKIGLIFMLLFWWLLNQWWRKLYCWAGEISHGYRCLSSRPMTHMGERRDPCKMSFDVHMHPPEFGIPPS